MTKHYIALDGTIETELEHDTWLEAFIDWLESRKETYGGMSEETDESGDPLQETP